MYAIGRRKNWIETVGRMPLSKQNLTWVVALYKKILKIKIMRKLHSVCKN